MSFPRCLGSTNQQAGRASGKRAKPYIAAVRPSPKGRSAPPGGRWPPIPRRACEALAASTSHLTVPPGTVEGPGITVESGTSSFAGSSPKHSRGGDGRKGADEHRGRDQSEPPD